MRCSKRSGSVSSCRKPSGLAAGPRAQPRTSVPSATPTSASEKRKPDIKVERRYRLDCGSEKLFDAVRASHEQLQRDAVARALVVLHVQQVFASGERNGRSLRCRRVLMVV